MNLLKKDKKKNVCPDDRHLMQRSQIRAGWCTAQSDPPLTASEREAIAEVVRRADEVDEIEARRIGRLVARLDGLRESAQGPSETNCLLCGDTAKLFTPLRSCCVCKHWACTNCVMDVGPPQRPFIFSKQKYMCHLCAETREIWKKSGAWFYKSIPKYVLPPKMQIGRYREARMPRSLQDTGTSSNDSESGSPRSIHRPFSRQSSNTDRRRSLGSFLEYDWNEREMLAHGVSRLSLQRSQSPTSSLPSRPYTIRRITSKPSAIGPQNVRKELPKLIQDERPSQVADVGFGIIEIKMVYDEETLTLTVTVLKARNLVGMDMTDLSDPFCRLEIVPREGTFMNRLRTKTVHKSKNPEFNETFQFFGLSKYELKTKSLEVVLFDDDQYGCDEMGAAKVELTECQEGPAQMYLSLSGISSSDPKGPKLLVALYYNIAKRVLVVTVCRAADLPPKDRNGFSDPFVKLHLNPDPYRKKFKTTTKWRNLNPVWDEEFTFETRPTQLPRQNLTLTLWDKDYGKPNDYLGTLVLGASSKGRRLKHWMDCVKFPDNRHEQWHSLTDNRRA